MAGPPLAVAPTNPVPGLYLTVDFLRGAASPGSAPLRGLIIGPKATGQGDIVVNTEIRSLGGADDARTAAGAGSLPHLAAKTWFLNCPEAVIDLVCPTESAGAAATNTFTFAGTLTKNVTVEWDVMGRVIQTPWNLGQTADTFKGNAVAALNQYSDDLHVSFSSGGVGIVTGTAKTKGPTGNDVKVSVRIIEASSGGTVDAGQSSSKSLTGGTTEPDFTTAIATAAGTEYDFIALCVSSADAESASASSNPARLVAAIGSANIGLNAKLQFGVIASVGLTTANAKTGALARNSEVLEHMLILNARSLPSEIAGAEAGDSMRRRALNSNPNRIGTKLKGIYGAKDTTADDPTQPEAQDALDNGVSICGYNPATKELQVLRAITTHARDTAGNVDKRIFDTNEVFCMYDYAKDLRAGLPQEFFQAKLARDTKANEEPPPKGVVEERDVKSWIVSRTTSFWVPEGNINGAKFAQAVNDNKLIVAVNASDETQCDIFIPASPFKILAKFGLYVAKAA